MVAISQDVVIDFLSDAAAYGDTAAAVTRYETHAAVVFVVGTRAYKMKRAVQYSFLDFSSLERRHTALLAEIELNRRTAPGLYRRVLPVCETKSGLTLDGDGPVVEWLLEMERFAQEALLSNMAAAGELRGVVMDDLARAIAALHDVAYVNRDAGGYDGMAAVVDGNTVDLGAVAAGRRLRRDVKKLTALTRRELAAQRSLLEARRRDGFVRHCHGDLHLGNIVMLDGKPVLYDCIEFDDDLATIDTFYDLAFVLMDLCERGLTAAANRLLNGYLEVTGDDAGTALLALFMAVRATIRAKIEGFEADVCHDDAQARHIREFGRYLALAARLLTPQPVRLVAIGGVSGTGKSSVARALAPDLGALPGAVVLRSDVIRKQMFGAAATERLPATAYTSAASRRVYDRIAARAGALLAAGRAVIVDGTCLDPAVRERLKGVAWQHDAAFDGIWLKGSFEVLAARVAGRHGDASDADVAVLREQLAAAPQTDWAEVNAGGRLAEVTAEVRALIGGPNNGVAG